MEQSKFEEIRAELLVEAVTLDDYTIIPEQFKRKFFRLIEICTFSMMNGSEDFFAYFFIQMRREINADLQVPCESNIMTTGFIIYFNPLMFLEHTELEMHALIKHEIYHIMSGHHQRAKAIQYKYSSLAISLAMDISINEYIINLPRWMPRLINIKKSYDVYLSEDSTMEQYAEFIQQALDKLKKDKQGAHENLSKEEMHIFEDKYKPQEVHKSWEKDEEFDAESLKEITKKYALNASKGRIPESIEEYLRQLKGNSELSWKDYLRRLLGVLPADYKKTITRRDRRQPERLDLRGRLRQHIAQIAVAIDISGSISDVELEQIMNEVLAIVKNYPHELTVIECDSDIRRVYKVKNIKDIRKKLNTKGHTRFSPIFKYLKESNMKNYILIYFTDGLGEEKLELAPVNKKTIWVLTGKGEKLSLKEPFGTVKRLSDKKVVQPEYDYAPNAIKEHRMLEWSSF